MKTPYNTHDYALNLGKLISSLQSFEYCLRVFLLEIDTRKSDPTINPTKYEELKIGDYVPTDAFTNYDTLGKLIRKYNKIILPIDPKFEVSTSIVDVRDALAHGRIASLSLEGNMHLLKFNEPKNNQVEVVYSAEMDSAWFKSNIQFAQDEINKVISASNKMGMQIFSVVRVKSSSA